MSENQDDNEKQKRKHITLAKIAFVFAIIAILCPYALFRSPYQPAVGAVAFWVLFSGAAIVLSLVSLLGRRKQKDIIDKVLAIFSIVVPAIIIVDFIFLPGLSINHELPPRIVCATNLSGLGKAMHVYSQDSNDKNFPTPDNWCDLLVKYDYVSEKQFICIKSKKSGNTKRSHFAMNPNCKPDSPPDIVLLFETKGGWNQFGQAELLTTQNHEETGCNIFFNDKSVRFVTKEELSELKWK
ncbi:MAG: hypothetical protein ACYSWP_16880 [Planctomycetota bacterium]|jgi:heme/copper-type cytochrome/quinol oxidase subunit 4